MTLFVMLLKLGNSVGVLMFEWDAVISRALIISKNKHSGILLRYLVHHLFTLIILTQTCINIQDLKSTSTTSKMLVGLTLLLFMLSGGFLAVLRCNTVDIVLCINGHLEFDTKYFAGKRI